MLSEKNLLILQSVYSNQPAPVHEETLAGATENTQQLSCMILRRRCSEIVECAASVPGIKWVELRRRSSAPQALEAQSALERPGWRRVTSLCVFAVVNQSSFHHLPHLQQLLWFQHAAAGLHLVSLTHCDPARLNVLCQWFCLIILLILFENMPSSQLFLCLPWYFYNAINGMWIQKTSITVTWACLEHSLGQVFSGVSSTVGGRKQTFVNRCSESQNAICVFSDAQNNISRPKWISSAPLWCH